MKINMGWPKGRKLVHAVAVLIGTVVGAGIFGIPFAFAQAGFLSALFFLLALAILTIIMGVAYGEVTLRTSGNHQMPGYADKYLGKRAKQITAFAFFFSAYGALLAYIIIAGNFLHILGGARIFSSPFSWSLVFFAFAAFIVARGLKTVAWFETVMSSFFVAIILLVAFFGIGKIEGPNLLTFNWNKFFLPYGVVLFALAGIASIPIQRELLSHDEKKLKKAIIWGIAIPALLYLLFAFIVVGINGSATSPDAISGLQSFLNGKVIALLSLFGVLALTTSFIIIATALIEIFNYDYRISPRYSWALTVFLPLLLFLFVTRSFIYVVSTVGALAMSLQGVIIMLMFLVAKRKGEREPEFSLSLPLWSVYIVIGVFATGGIYALVRSLAG